MTVRFADAEPNGLADLVGRLIDANLREHPDRRQLLSETVVELSASDANMHATLDFTADDVLVSNGRSNGRAHLRVRADAYDLVEFAAAPLRLGLPDVFVADGRAAIGRVLRGHVRVSGMLRHPLRLSRFNRLLSVAE
jgi:hypothetical protein